MKLTKKQLRLIEFLVIGVFVGLAEDLLAIAVATDASLNPRVIFVVLLVALPFAFLSEYVVDHPRFWSRVFRGRIEGTVEEIKKKVVAPLVPPKHFR